MFYFLNLTTLFSNFIAYSSPAVWNRLTTNDALLRLHPDLYKDSNNYVYLLYKYNGDVVKEADPGSAVPRPAYLLLVLISFLYVLHHQKDCTLLQDLLPDYTVCHCPAYYKSTSSYLFAAFLKYHFVNNYSVHQNQSCL